MSVSLMDGNPPSLIDTLLREQSSLTAVDRFSREYQRQGFASQQRYYQALLPLMQPQAGEQFAFAVDLDACTGCKACVSACHSLNGLEEDEVWRNVGMLHSEDANTPYQQTVTTACHHCIEPACLSGCPVQAYEKDAQTGVVRHLDDQCIGCQYCILKCPYDVPKYSKDRGIVRKCDMCASRLAVGEAPACVQACPNEAITIRVINQTLVKSSSGISERLVPGAFSSSYTIPTTRYSSERGILEGSLPGNGSVLRPEPPHWPLIGMLVLTQLAAGLALVASGLSFLKPDVFVKVLPMLAIGTFAALHLGLGVSILHLGQPLKAWRSFLGWKTSWMSREILGLGAFSAGAGGSLFSSLWTPLHAYAALSAHFATILGLVGVACSVMVYVDTRRAFWSAEQTCVKFGGAALLLGLSAAIIFVITETPTVGLVLNALFIVFGIALFGWEFVRLQKSFNDSSAEDHLSASLMWTLQRKLSFSRIAISLSGITASLCIFLNPGVRIWLAAVAFILFTAGTVLERYQFFTAVIAPRMPGPLASANRPEQNASTI